MGDASAGASALLYVTAMGDTVHRLPQVNAEDRPRAFAMIGEAVWWVTIVNATLVRYHPKTYDAVMGDRSPAERRLIEDTLAGLRFVRNRIAHETDPADLVEPGAPGPQPGTGGGAIARAGGGSRCRNRRSPCFHRAGRHRELTRYRAYQAQLAGHTVGETFERAAEFLNLTAAHVPRPRSQHARHPLTGPHAPGRCGLAPRPRTGSGQRGDHRQQGYERDEHVGEVGVEPAGLQPLGAPAPAP